MNFLSHYYISGKPNNPYYTLGLILPDFARQYVKTFFTDKPFDKPEFEQLYLGCLQHYSDDKLFHGSKFFEEHTLVCTQIVTDAGFDKHIQRKWFLGHVFFELYLDRILVNHIPGLVQAFYKNLSLVEPKIVMEYLALFDCPNPEKLVAIIQNFVKFAYIKNYIDNNLFVYSLSRLMIRVKAGEMNWDDKLIMYNCLMKLENQVLKDKLTTLYLLKNVFK